MKELLSFIFLFSIFSAWAEDSWEYKERAGMANAFILNDGTVIFMDGIKNNGLEFAGEEFVLEGPLAAIRPPVGGGGFAREGSHAPKYPVGGGGTARSDRTMPKYPVGGGGYTMDEVQNLDDFFATRDFLVDYALNGGEIFKEAIGANSFYRSGGVGGGGQE